MKKLSLNKETIANLSEKEAYKLVGASGVTCLLCESGYSEYPEPCYTDCKANCRITLGCSLDTTCC